MPKPKIKSRPVRWAEAAVEAMVALDTLVDIQSEYQEWMDNLPENLNQSAVAEKLQTICDLDFGSALSTAEEADGAELPMDSERIKKSYLK